MFLGGWFGGAGVSVSLVVEERDRDEEMGDKSIVFYSICFVVYIILLVVCKNKNWDVEWVVKWVGKIDKVVSEDVK